MKESKTTWTIFLSLILFALLMIGFIFVMFFTMFVGAVGHQTTIKRSFTPIKVEILQEPIAELEIKQFQRGCEYWYSVVDTLDANEVEKDWIKRIMFCESTCNPNAISSAGAKGLMQYMPKTWNWMGGGDINNPYEQIEMSLMMYRMGMANHWCCN